MRTLLALAVLAATTSAFADADKKPQDPKYAAMDAARVKFIAALDTGDAAALTEVLDSTPVDVKDLWFDTAKCRKQWTDGKLTAKTAPALVACIKGLHVYGIGMSTYYGPGVDIGPRFDYVDGKAVLRHIVGNPLVVDSVNPTIWSTEFQKHRTEGQPVVLDQPAKDELAELGDHGVVIEACADAKGIVKAKRYMPRISAKGPTAKLVTATLATWKFEPLQVRDKPATVCAMFTAH